MDATAGTTTEPTRAHTATEGAETIKVSLEIVYSIDNSLSLLDAMAAAKGVLDKAKEHGSAIGEVVMGRKRFAL